MRLSFSEFCEVVREAVDSLPASLRPYLENVVVDVEDEPGPRDIDRLHEQDRPDDNLLLGLFIGVPLTQQPYGERYPNQIKIFRRPLERICSSRKELLKQIRATVIHEFAHHFGFSEEDLEPFEAAQEQPDDED